MVKRSRREGTGSPDPGPIPKRGRQQLSPETTKRRARSNSRGMPLSSHIGPSTSHLNRELHASPETTRLAPNPGAKPAEDPFFPDFPERICFELECDAMPPHTHKGGINCGSDGFLPTAEDYRKAYEELEVQATRDKLYGPRPATSHDNPAAASTLDSSITSTTGPSQKTDTAAEDVTAEDVTAPAESRRLKPPSSRSTSQLRRSLPEIPSEQKRPRRNSSSHIIPPARDLPELTSAQSSSYHDTAYDEQPRGRSIVPVPRPLAPNPGTSIGQPQRTPSGILPTYGMPGGEGMAIRARTETKGEVKGKEVIDLTEDD